MRARTDARNIIDVLNERTCKYFKTQDVRNLITRIRESEDKQSSVEEALGNIRDNGGDVRYLKEQGTNNVDVLWVQTRDMRSHLTKCKPQVFECDTTFGTQVEGYKLYIPLFHSNHTDKWEVAGILFLSTETKEKVHAGVKFFKASLPYKIDDGVTKFIFFTDKDFDSIEIGKYILYMSRCIHLNLSSLQIITKPCITFILLTFMHRLFMYFKVSFCSRKVITCITWILIFFMHRLFMCH